MYFKVCHSSDMSWRKENKIPIYKSQPVSLPLELLECGKTQIEKSRPEVEVAGVLE